MKSFRTEIENPVVEQDIIELERKIFQFKNNEIDEERFRSLRLARGVYGQRQQGVQMIRIKLPYGKISAPQLRRIAAVSDEYSNGNLHITTRQDIQIHHVSLDRTPELWAELEKDQITLREACGNTVRNVTASVMAGADPAEAFDVSPYAAAFFEYFLRNPICQDMGRKFKVAFSSSAKDDAFSFVHDLGFMPSIKQGIRGFKVVLGGGIGAQPRQADVVYEHLPTDQLIPFSEAVIRVFDRYGERNRRNKARLKFLVKEVGIDQFLEWVSATQTALPYSNYPIEIPVFSIKETALYKPEKEPENFQYKRWVNTNVKTQKQDQYAAVGLAIETGDFSSETARKLAAIMEVFCGEDARLTVGQSLLLRSVRQENLPALYEALSSIGLARVGFHKINDIVACPGTDTCNLGIASSMGLAKKLNQVIENEFEDLISETQIDIKISGCMNACGQHTLANIGFQGMTIKADGKVAPATQLLLGGGSLGRGQGRFADKILKVPAKRTPDVLRWILNDFKNFSESEENFNSYYDRKSADYFYQNLKHFGETEALNPSDFIDWGNEDPYEKAIGIGECAGVTIDLVQTLLVDAEEQLQNAGHNLDQNAWTESIYLSYAGGIRAAKALLTSKNATINTHESIIVSFDTHFPTFSKSTGKKFSDVIKQIEQNKPSKNFALHYFDQVKTTIEWIKTHAHESN